MAEKKSQTTIYILPHTQNKHNNNKKKKNNEINNKIIFILYIFVNFSSKYNKLNSTIYYYSDHNINKK